MIFQKNDVEIQRFDADRQFLEVPLIENGDRLTDGRRSLFHI